MLSVYYDANEARSLLREYQSALTRCRNGSLLKEEFTKLNLRMFSFGLTFPPDSALGESFQELMNATSARRSQSGIFTSMDEVENVQRWIDFLVHLLEPAGEILATTKVKPAPIV